MNLQNNNPFKKKKTSKSITWHDSDAPDAKGKFKSLSPDIEYVNVDKLFENIEKYISNNCSSVKKIYFSSCPNCI